MYVFAEFSLRSSEFYCVILVEHVDLLDLSKVDPDVNFINM